MELARDEKPRDKLNLLSVVVSATHYAYQITLINDENCLFLSRLAFVARFSFRLNLADKINYSLKLWTSFAYCNQVLIFINCRFCITYDIIPGLLYQDYK